MIFYFSVCVYVMRVHAQDGEEALCALELEM